MSTSSVIPTDIAIRGSAKTLSAISATRSSSLRGVVSHATNLVEHPQLVADRILRYAQIVGRENVIAGTDCGLGGRVHADLAWAKLRSLAEGARLASKELWAQTRSSTQHPLRLGQSMIGASPPSLRRIKQAGKSIGRRRD
jgi:hypothetical protein